ncbi:MAG: hypothetical protein GKS03_12040 [Alphaproteobacteria bacterium]|nr:hypothetical protein [Alphaproteobacteria bacterium]
MSGDEVHEDKFRSKVDSTFQNDRPLVRLLIFSGAAAVTAMGGFASAPEEEELTRSFSLVVFIFLLAVLFSFIGVMVHAYVISEEEDGNVAGADFARSWFATPAILGAVTLNVYGILYAALIFGRLAF